METVDRIIDALGFELVVRPRLSSESRRSLAFAHAVQQHLIADPDAVLGVARRNVEQMVVRGGAESRWANVWSAVLALPPEIIAGLLVDEGSFAADLRQSSPFAGVISAEERQQIIMETRRATDCWTASTTSAAHRRHAGFEPSRP